MILLVATPSDRHRGRDYRGLFFLMRGAPAGQFAAAPNRQAAVGAESFQV
jgi:hypothetical protein